MGQYIGLLNYKTVPIEMRLNPRKSEKQQKSLRWLNSVLLSFYIVILLSSTFI